MEKENITYLGLVIFFVGLILLIFVFVTAYRVFQEPEILNITFPETIDALAIDTPTVKTECCPDHTISIAWMLANQGMHGRQQKRLIVRHPQPVSLRTAGLTQDPACTTLRNAQFALNRLHRLPLA